MPPVFYPGNSQPEALNRGPGRLGIASISQAMPTQISDVINMSLYSAQAGWTDIGYTKGGVQIGFNNSEDSLDVDQVNATLMTIPNGTEMYVNTTLAESTLDRLSFAWEGDAITTNASTSTGVPEKNTAFGAFETYTQRRLFVGYRNAQSGKVRLHVFRKAQRAPQESVITFNKSGDQLTIPMRFNILPDTSIANVLQRYGVAFDQQ